MTILAHAADAWEGEPIEILASGVRRGYAWRRAFAHALFNPWSIAALLAVLVPIWLAGWFGAVSSATVELASLVAPLLLAAVAAVDAWFSLWRTRTWEDGVNRWIVDREGFHFLASWGETLHFPFDRLRWAVRSWSFYLLQFQGGVTEWLRFDWFASEGERLRFERLLRALTVLSDGAEHAASPPPSGSRPEPGADGGR